MHLMSMSVCLCVNQGGRNHKDLRSFHSFTCSGPRGGVAAKATLKIPCDDDGDDDALQTY